MRGTACIAVTGNVAPIIKECHIDVENKSGVSFWKQDLQVWEMTEEINLVCAILKISEDQVKDRFKEIFLWSEKKFGACNSTIFPPNIFFQCHATDSF